MINLPVCDHDETHAQFNLDRHRDIDDTTKDQFSRYRLRIPLEALFPRFAPAPLASVAAAGVAAADVSVSTNDRGNNE